MEATIPPLLPASATFQWFAPASLSPAFDRGSPVCPNAVPSVAWYIRHLPRKLPPARQRPRDTELLVDGRNLALSDPSVDGRRTITKAQPASQTILMLVRGA